MTYKRWYELYPIIRFEFENGSVFDWSATPEQQKAFGMQVSGELISAAKNGMEQSKWEKRLTEIMHEHGIATPDKQGEVKLPSGQQLKFGF